jgi:hypothetical protein
VLRRTLMLVVVLGLLALLTQSVAANARNDLEAGVGTVTVNGQNLNSIQKAAVLSCSLNMRFSGFKASSARVRIQSFKATFDAKVQLGTLVDTNVALSNGAASRTFAVSKGGTPTDSQGRIRVKIIVGGGGSNQKATSTSGWRAAAEPGRHTFRPGRIDVPMATLITPTPARTRKGIRYSPTAS